MLPLFTMDVYWLYYIQHNDTQDKGLFSTLSMKTLIRSDTQ